MVANCKNVVEAKRLCYEVQQAITQSFQVLMAQEQARLSEGLTSFIPLLDITNKGDGFKVNQALYALLADEKLRVTNELLGGLPNVIESFVNEEMSNRSLESLKTIFL